MQHRHVTKWQERLQKARERVRGTGSLIREHKLAVAVLSIGMLIAGFGVAQAVAPGGAPTVSCLPGSATVGPDGSFVLPLQCNVAGLPTATGSPTPTGTTAPPTTVPPTTTPPVPTTTPPVPTTTPPVTTTAPPTTTPPPTTTAPPGGCPVAGTNVPGGKDPWGGCWPGPGNTGIPAGTVLTPYTGPCTITTNGTVIDSKTVTCSVLVIKASNVMIKNSLLQGVDLSNYGQAGTTSFFVQDSKITNGARDQCMCVGTHNFTALRVEVVGGNRSMYCESHCVIQDSWLHGQQLQGAQHGSGLREEQFTTAMHNSLVCDYPFTNDATTLGCSADLTGYPDFAPIHDNLIKRNLFLQSLTVSFCAYGGDTGGKPFSGDPANATNQQFIENVFQRGLPGDHGQAHCGYYGPITDFNPNRTGNVWSGNVWDNGGTVSPA